MSNDLQAEVIPLRKLPIGADVFSYNIPLRLRAQTSVGRIVQIPFRNQNVYGVVKEVSRRTKGDFELKEIKSVTDLSLTEQQMSIASWLARHYYQSQALVMRQFAATPPKKAGSSDAITHHFGNLSLPRISVKDVSRQAYVLFQRYGDITAYIIEVIRHLKDRRGQTLIIVPELRHLDFIASALQASKLSSQVLIVPPRQQKNAFFKVWRESQSAPIVLGTGRAVLMPFSHLSQVCLVEAENGIFQQAEQNPRYHLVDVIDMIAKTYGAELLLTGFSPQINLLSRTEKLLPLRQLRTQKQHIEVIDMRPERQRKTYRLLSERTQETIKASSGPALLLLNRLGRARTLLCLDCRYVALCSRCGHPLAVGRSDTALVCSICSLSQAMPLTCPKCHGTNIRWRGAGVSSLVTEIRELLPSRRVIEISGADVDPAEVPRDSIVVATNKVFSLSFRHFSLAVAVNPDVDLQLPRYQAAENLRQHLLKLSAMADRTLIQTYVPDHYIYQTLADVKAFYRQELVSRKDFGYPPYATFIKVSARNRDRSELRQKMMELQKHFQEYNPFGPFETATKTTYQAHLIIKVSSIDSRLDFLLQHSYNWGQIEINPFDVV